MSDEQVQATVFKYERPDSLERPKTMVRLFRADIARAEVQVIREGGENNLHSHSGSNGFWMVLGGKARFYGDGDEVLAELGPYEGVHIPRTFKYWFESAGDEVLEILHVTSNLKEFNGVYDRVDDASERPAWMGPRGGGGV